METINDICACLSLRKKSRRITSHFNECMRTASINITQLHVLVQIQNNAYETATWHAHALGLERTTFCRNVNRLIKLGFLVPINSFDKRQRLYSLTEKARLALDFAYPMWKFAQDSIPCDLKKNG